MMRLCLLTVMLFSCVTSLGGMFNAAPAIKATCCAEMHNVFCRGLVKSALCAISVAALATYFDESMHMQEGQMGIMKYDLAKRIALGYVVIAFPIVLNSIASLFDRHVPYVTNKYLKCGYGALALYLMLNSTRVVNALL